MQYLYLSFLYIRMDINDLYNCVNFGYLNDKIELVVFSKINIFHEKSIRIIGFDNIIYSLRILIINTINEQK